MDVVAFAVDRTDDLPEIVVRVNGELLQDLARVVERPRADAEGHPDLAGSYAGLDPRIVEPDHFLSRPTEQWFEDRDTVLLDCECGFPGCWPLASIVTVEPTSVTWSGFLNGRRGWDLGALGPFVFDRRQYESALSSLDA